MKTQRKEKKRKKNNTFYQHYFKFDIHIYAKRAVKKNP